jgi:Uma2 family endonuclease
LLWVEVVSQDDRLVDLWEKAAELLKLGVPYVWIIEPNTLKSELHTAEGILSVPDKTLRLPNSPIVIPLAEVMEE